MDRLSPERRYFTDPIFKTLVDVLHAHIKEAKFTPTELREACHLAACMYEERYVRPLLVDPHRPFE